MKLPLRSLDAIDINLPMISSIAAVQETRVISFKIIEVSSYLFILMLHIFEFQNWRPFSKNGLTGS